MAGTLPSSTNPNWTFSNDPELVAKVTDVGTEDFDTG
jgi:hypothetical protein